MDTFSECKSINDRFRNGDEQGARNQLIKLIDQLEAKKAKYPPVLNSLIRQAGLYPYIQEDGADWQDRFVYEAFKSNVGVEEPVVLHREQSKLLKRLLSGQSFAVSAPTSFGKSFIIDAFIAIKKPTNVVIIVPTIALTDETRRRIYKKFASEYTIITTADAKLGDRNIMIFPQERALAYSEKLDKLDILIVDEFYKASVKFDKERSPALLRAILKMEAIAEQRYYLAPNVSSLHDSPFTKGMEFVPLSFNTVFLDVKEVFRSIGKDEGKKGEQLLRILREASGKTLIYVATYTNIDKVSTLLLSNTTANGSEKLEDFGNWLKVNYGANWNLPNLVARGVGIHNGQLHRSLSQIQIKLFEEDDGLRSLISTSSIIEGVNTSAENVVIWSNKKGGRGNPRLDDFTYRNIIGRGGRMFKHFIGKIHLLEQPPEPDTTQLTIEIPDKILGEYDEQKQASDLTPEQIAKIIQYKEEMKSIFGKEKFKEMQEEHIFQTSDYGLIMQVSNEMKNSNTEWAGLAYLNSSDPDKWDPMLYKIINMNRGGWDIEHNKFVSFIKVLSLNWTNSIPDQLQLLDEFEIGIHDYFKLERNVSYKFASLAGDVNTIFKCLYPNSPVDISPFIYRLSHAFLPSVVYQLEEYGLPRMIAKLMQQSKIIDFTDQELTLHSAIDWFRDVGFSKIIESTIGLSKFDKYIIAHFFDGITTYSEEKVGG